MVSTTDTALAAIGPTTEMLELRQLESAKEAAAFSYEFAHAAGKYVGTLSRVLSALHLPAESQTPVQLPPPDISSSDHSARGVYRRVARAYRLRSVSLAPAVMFVLASVNTARHLLPAILPPRSNLLLRMQFLTAYHATNALREFGGRRLARSQILDGPDADTLLAARAVRNLMAHYALREAARHLQPGREPLEAAVAGMTGWSRDQTTDLVTRQLDRISNWMGRTVSKPKLNGTPSWVSVVLGGGEAP